MYGFYRAVKNSSFWTIPLFSGICLLSLILQYVFFFMDSTDGILAILGDLLSFLFVYGVALFLIVYGRIKENKRMQSLIVFLAGIYLCVSAFVDGVQGILVLLSGNTVLMVARILAFLLGLLWFFILAQGSLGYLFGNFERRLSTIGICGLLVCVLQTAFLAMNIASIFALEVYTSLDVWEMVLRQIVPLTFLFALYVTFVDVYFNGPFRNKMENDKAKEDNIDDLDIHTY